MEITLYHGSPKIIDHPQFGVGNPRNDYGLGFYCTENLELAKEWACSGTGGGFANEYAFDTSGLSILRLNKRPYHILNWLAILLDNRIFDIKTPVTIQARRFILDQYLPDYKSADVIVGYRADDSYFTFSRSFLENTISLAQLQRAMHLGRLGEQVVLKSENAFGRIVFKGSLRADGALYYPLRTARDRAAREAYFQLQKEEPLGNNAVYIKDIIQQNWQNDDPRLF